MDPVQTHFAVVYFDGDPGNEHPDPELHGQPPQLDLIAAGDEQFCWESLHEWTATHPLRPGETAEVLTRDPQLVKARMDLATPPPDMPHGQYGPTSDYGDDCP